MAVPKTKQLLKATLHKVRKGHYLAHCNVLPRPVRVEISKGNNAYIIRSPNLKGAKSWADTLEEAERNAKQAVGSAIEHYLDFGLPFLE